MAAFNIEINVPDDKVQGLIDAYNWRLSNNPEMPLGMTGAQVKNHIKAQIVQKLRAVYQEHQRYLAEQASPLDDLGAE